MRGVNGFIDTKSQPSIQIYLKVHSYLLNPYCEASSMVHPIYLSVLVHSFFKLIIK